MDINKFIQKWTNNVNAMQNDIIKFGMNVNDDHGNYWQRNKTKLLVLLLFAGSTAMFYYLDWILLFRIMGIMLIIYLLTNIYYLIATLFKR